MMIRSIIIAVILTIVLPGYAENQGESAWKNLSSEDNLLSAESFTAGTIIFYLPDGARSLLIEQNQYFISGGNWFLPVIKDERVAFLVVFAPI